MPEQPTAKREGGEGPAARLTVRLEGVGGAAVTGLPVEVRTASLRRAASGWTAEPILLPAGGYVISARLPGGPPLLAEIDLAPGEERTVVLGPSGIVEPPELESLAAAAAEPAAAEPPPGETAAMPAGPPRVQRIVRLPPMPATAAVERVYVARRPPAPELERGSRTVTFHLLTGNPLDGPLRGRGAPWVRVALGGPAGAPRLESVAGGEWVFTIPDDPAAGPVLEVRPDPDLPKRAFALLRMAEPGAPARFVAVPVTWGHTIRVRLEPASGEDPFRVSAETDDPMSEALLQYRHAGQMDEARSLLRRHRAEAFGAEPGVVPPLRLAVIALLTLRLADPREAKSGFFYYRLLEAAERLDFPDLAAAAAEAAARLGRMDLFRSLAARATARGLPYLSDALALLHTRLLEAARPPDPDDAMRGLYQRLSPLLGLVDLKPTLLTLRGGDDQLYRPDPGRSPLTPPVGMGTPDLQLT
jgi:hypothetical protein